MSFHSQVVLFWLCSWVPLSLAADGRLALVFSQAKLVQQSCTRGLSALSPQTKAPIIHLAKLQSTTAHLKMRPLAPGDTAQLTTLLCDPKLRQESGEDLDAETVANILASGPVDGQAFRPGTLVNLGFFEAGNLVGFAQLAGPSSRYTWAAQFAPKGENWAELQLFVASDRWQEGLGSEILTAVEQTAFRTLHLDGLHGQSLASNLAAHQTMRKNNGSSGNRVGNWIMNPATKPIFRAV